ncbi:MFS transporter [Rhodococcus sp. 3Y1]
MPTLARELRATTVDLQWITNAYTLAFAALLITAGGLGARFGHRRILLTGLTLFALGSAFAALSHTSMQLIGWRTVMGQPPHWSCRRRCHLSSRCSPRTREAGR